MLRRISQFLSQRTIGRGLVVVTSSLFLSACGGQVGGFGGVSTGSGGSSVGMGISLPTFLGGEEPEPRPVGVLAAPNTDWGYVNTASDDFVGLVVSDEPQATMVGRDILSQGGNAADAATAVFFALAATNPAGASVGGGGICLVHDTRTGIARSVDFLPRAPRRSGPIAVPGAVRGFGYIQAEWGDMTWRNVVEPGSDLAATHQVSRTLARRILDQDGVVQTDPDLRAMFSGPGGNLLSEGERLRQPELAGTIGIIGSRGSQEFYTGELSRRILEETADQGGTLTIEDLQSYQPNVSTAQVIEVGDRVGFLPTGATGAGFFFPALSQKAAQGGPVNGAADLNNDAREVLAEAGVRGGLLRDYGSSSFAVMDATGLSVVCGVTMNGPFGNQETGESTGALFSRSPLDIQHGLAGAFVTPLIVTNGDGSRVRMLAGSAGGPDASAALLFTALNEPGAGLEQSLQNNGSNAYGTVNAITCQGSSRCRIGVDPRGSGMGAEALSWGE